MIGATFECGDLRSINEPDRSSTLQEPDAYVKQYSPFSIKRYALLEKGFELRRHFEVTDMAVK